MSWLEDTDTSTDTAEVKDNWLKIPNPTAIHGVTEVRLRVLDDDPVGVWRHWFEKRPYNCPGMDTCPVCKVRNEAKKSDPEGYKNRFRLDYRYFFNVLFEHEVKIFNFTSTVGRKLKVFEEKYGSLRNYDVSVRKRKTGPLDQNIEYDVIFEKEYPLTTEDVAISEVKFDRAPFVKPATQDELRAIATGSAPTHDGEVATSEEVNGKSTKASKADMIMLTTLIKAKGFELSHFGIVDGAALPKEVVSKLIEELKSEK